MEVIEIETQTVTIEVTEYRNTYKSVVLAKNIILQKIKELDKQAIFERLCLEIDSGVRTVTCFMDLRDGSIFYSYLGRNESFHISDGINYLKIESLNEHFQTPFKKEIHRFKNPKNFYEKSSWIDWNAYMSYAFYEINKHLYYVYDFDREKRGY